MVLLDQGKNECSLKIIQVLIEVCVCPLINFVFLYVMTFNKGPHEKPLVF